MKLADNIFVVEWVKSHGSAEAKLRIENGVTKSPSRFDRSGGTERPRIILFIILYSSQVKCKI